jgi:hypothetical protein
VSFLASNQGNLFAEKPGIMMVAAGQLLHDGLALLHDGLAICCSAASSCLLQLACCVIAASGNTVEICAHLPSLSMSAIIFLISSFLGSKPRALKQHVAGRAQSSASQ